jgi:hypothetical protein
MERPPPVRLWLLGDICRAMVVVWDACPLPPVLIHPRADAVTGRGLLLVEAASSGWGSYPAPQSGGKAVWALVDTGERA